MQRAGKRNGSTVSLEILTFKWNENVPNDFAFANFVIFMLALHLFESELNCCEEPDEVACGGWKREVEKNKYPAGFEPTTLRVHAPQLTLNYKSVILNSHVKNMFPK